MYLTLAHPKIREKRQSPVQGSALSGIGLAGRKMGMYKHRQDSHDQ